MRSRLKAFVHQCLRRTGIDVTILGSSDPLPVDVSAEDGEILRRARPFTLTTYHRLAAMLDATAYIVDNGVAGAIVECGVWRGGSMMVSAMKLMHMDAADRDLYLYDTYAGMPSPTSHDADFTGTSAQRLLDQQRKGAGIWAEASIEEVRANLAGTGYPRQQIHLIEGRVEETLRRTLPDAVAILRLDTDWYESTRHELIALYPRLSPGGVLIVDDYGHWRGARKAVDEYFSGVGAKPFLARIDYTCRVLLKTEPKP